MQLERLHSNDRFERNPSPGKVRFLGSGGGWKRTDTPYATRYRTPILDPFFLGSSVDLRSSSGSKKIQILISSFHLPLTLLIKIGG